MPVYNTATAATAIGVTAKWLDNLLSHNNIDGLQPDAQGIARRLSLNTITLLTVAKELIDVIGLPVPAAIRLATRLLNTAEEPVVSPLLHITIDKDTLRSTVLGRLARAVEIAPTPRRGRPPKR